MLYTKSEWWTLVAQEPFLPVFQENFDAVCRNNKQKSHSFKWFYCNLQQFMAERQGFEPCDSFIHHTIYKNVNPMQFGAFGQRFFVIMVQFYQTKSI